MVKLEKIFYINIFIIIGFLFFIPLFSIQARVLECKDYKNEQLSQKDYQKVIDICDAEINQERDELTQKRGETSGVKYEISKLDRKIRISQAFINQKTAKANRLNRDIKTNQLDIDLLKEDLKKTNKSLSILLFEKNILETNTALEAILISDSISNFFSDRETIKIISEKMSKKIKETKKEKKDLERLSIELGEREVLERQLANEKKIEAKSIARNKTYKKELLNILKKEEGVLEDSISIKEEARQAILKKKYTLASGKAVTFGEAYYAISPYKGVLGMDPAFILAILFQESGSRGKIGGNIGQCTYNQKNPCGKNQVMKGTQQVSFLKIMSGLGKNPSTQKVSCPICKDGSYGGAMGPAQFMPATWMTVRNKAASILGKQPHEMSPFVNGDAFIASAVLLKTNYYSKGCSDYANQYKHISSVRTLRERCAASKYYAGGAWWKYRMQYGQSVVRRADRFRADIRVLNDN